MFNAIKRATQWSELNRDIWLDLLRIWFGVALFLKGVSVLRDTSVLAAELSARGLPLAGNTLVHYAALAHFVGGTMMVFGLFTRIAALMQIPNVIGAILFIHLRAGLFSVEQGLQAATVSLMLLVMFAFTGSGRLSTEWYFSEHPRQVSGESLELLRMENGARRAPATESTQPH